MFWGNNPAFFVSIQKKKNFSHKQTTEPLFLGTTMPKKDQTKHNMESARVTAVKALYHQHFPDTPFMEDKATAYFTQLKDNASFTFVFTFKKEKYTDRITDVDRDVWLCGKREASCAKGKAKYKEGKENNSPAFQERAAKIAQKDKVRTQNERAVRQKVERGEPLSIEEEKTKAQLDNKRAHPRKITPRSAENVHAVALKLAKLNGQPDAVEHIEKQLQPLANRVSNSMFHQTTRKLNEPARARAREWEKTPRRRAKQKLAKAARGSRPSRTQIEQTREQRTKLADYQKSRRGAQGQVTSVSSPKRVVAQIRRKNELFQIRTGLDVQCDETVFVAEVMKFPCAYCGQEPAGSIDRPDSADHYHLLNILPCCVRCNIMKSLLLPHEFRAQCVIVQAFASEKTARSSLTCEYCGSTKRLGIDRVDSSIRGYDNKANCVPCCAMCNFLKKHLSLQDFLEHVRKVAQFQADIEQARISIQTLHVQLTQKHKTLVSPKPQRCITEHKGGRNPSQNLVNIVGKRRVYHSLLEDTQYLCMHKKSFQRPVHILPALDAISQRGCNPCKHCRKDMCDDEFALWRTTDAIRRQTIMNSRVARAMHVGGLAHDPCDFWESESEDEPSDSSEEDAPPRATSMKRAREDNVHKRNRVGSKGGYLILDTPRAADSILFVHNDEHFYHQRPECKTMLASAEEFRKVFFKDVVGQQKCPCYTCCFTISSNELRPTEAIFRIHRNAQRRLHQRAPIAKV